MTKDNEGMSDPNVPAAHHVSELCNHLRQSYAKVYKIAVKVGSSDGESVRVKVGER